MQEDGWMVERIKYLLVRPVNLRFVRILQTPPLGSEPTRLMDQVLPLLRGGLSDGVRIFLPKKQVLQLIPHAMQNFNHPHAHSYLFDRISVA